LARKTGLDRSTGREAFPYLNGPEVLDGHAQAAVISSVLGRPVRYLDLSLDDFVRQLKRFGLPASMVEACAAAMADPDIPGNQSSAEVDGSCTGSRKRSSSS
jgi:uncharacterized protein YbjT (DUF2867 family)